MAVDSNGKDGGPDQPSGDRNDMENDKEFLDAVQGCLEDLMSKENLAEDPVIQQHVNAQMYVPLYILAAHQKVLKLGPAASMETLLKAARQSDKLSVDAENMMIRPMMKQRRNTIILHDLPDDVQETELRELFLASPEPESLSAVKPDVNHTAFVTFNSDEAAQTVALWLRSQKFRGNSVKCAIKSDHYMRSFFPAQPVNPTSTLSQLSSPGQGAQAMSWPNSPWTGPGTPAWLSPGMGPAYDPMDWGAGGWAQAPEKGSGKGGKGGKKGGKKGKCKGGEGQTAEFDTEAAAHAEVASRMEQAMAGMGAPEEGEIDVGYTHEFRKYTKQEIVQICSSLESVSKPESFAKFEKEHKDAALFRSSPHKDWAPPPTPMTPFVTGGLAGDMGHRRSSSMSARDQADDQGDGARNRRRSRPRKGSAVSSGSWSRGPRTSRAGSGEYYEGGSGGDWGGWDWPGGAAEGGWASSADQGSRARQRTSSARRRSSWGDWYGQTWVEKKETEQGAEEKKDEEEKVAAKPTWVEKVKGIDKTPTWVEKVKGKMEAESSDSGAATKVSSGAARPAGPGSGSGAAAAQQPTGAEKG